MTDESTQTVLDWVLLFWDCNLFQGFASLFQ
jgi:hypothetical protein